MLNDPNDTADGSHYDRSHNQTIRLFTERQVSLYSVYYTPKHSKKILAVIGL